MRTLALALLLTFPLAAQTLDERVGREVASLLDTYKTLHAMPELSTQEVKTSAFLATRLRALGYEVTEKVGRYFCFVTLTVDSKSIKMSGIDD
jgi:metal-dependent amidase/aminoacylase/carboxypeptidase family protein